ncbi:MAG: LolA family protein [Planctomycetota bacterium]|jgi:hypothetical protein
MRRSLCLLVLLSGLFLTTSLLHSGEPAARKLSDPECEAFLKDYFKRNQELKAFSAEIQQEKSGGVFKRTDIKRGTLRVLLPSRLLLDMSDDGLKIVLDGTYAWLHDTDLDDVERYRLSSKEGGNEKADGSQMGGLALLMGKGGDSVEAILQRFRIEATEVEGIVRIRLYPKEEALKAKVGEMEVHFPKGGVLPIYIRTTGVKLKDAKRPPLSTIYRLSKANSNLDGLTVFPVNDFLFPLSEELEVREMGGKDGERVVPYDELKSEQKHQREGKAEE